MIEVFAVLAIVLGVIFFVLDIIALFKAQPSPLLLISFILDLLMIFVGVITLLSGP